MYYQVNYTGRTLMFNLTANNQLISNDYILERRSGSANRTEQGLSEGNSCHLLGTVVASDVRGTAAISTCKGLVRRTSHTLTGLMVYLNLCLIHQIESLKHLVTFGRSITESLQAVGGC